VSLRCPARAGAPPITTRALAALAAPLLVLLAVVTAEAHDFWLVPDAFQVAEGRTIEVRGQTSSRFPTSEAAVALDRVGAARLIGANRQWSITDLSHRGKSLLLRHKPSAPGQYVVAVTLRPRSVRESAASFRRYLELEGAPEALARIEREGLLGGRDSVTRRYAKYAKTLVQVGERGGRAFSRTARHPLEFIPTRDPARFRVGDTLIVRLFYGGRAAGGVRAHAGAVDWPLADESSAAAPDNDVHLTADANGTLRVPITRAGLWNVRTIHVVQAPPNSGADWDTHWATFVFQVGGPSGGAMGLGQASDSATAVATVRRYHELLAAGDSLGALGMLTDDAVVLESGGLETRAEYRSRHLPADIEFARAVRSERIVRHAAVRGDVAWVSSASSTQGEFRGRTVNSVGAELMVLVRTPTGWKISAIHWSSRSRRP
jgi:ketosteroid isomerase-like protein